MTIYALQSVILTQMNTSIITSPNVMRFLKAILIVLGVIVLSGCEDEKPPNPQDVWGSYKGHYGTTEDEIQIHQDWNFWQTLTWKGKVFKYNGKWSVQELALPSIFFMCHRNFLVFAGSLG